MKSPKETIASKLKDPWVIGTLLGLLFITAIRPCTRYEPAPPDPILGAVDIGLPSTVVEELKGAVTLVLLPLNTLESRSAELSETARLQEGIELWERDIGLRTLVSGEQTMVQFPNPVVLAPKQLSDVRTNWMNFAEGHSALIGLVDKDANLRAIVPFTKDGGIQAFHTAMLLNPPKSPKP